ncbi:MAG: porin [Flavobacteriales bacterium]|nr:porin [Flavobacteriales bacterium]
MKTFQLLAVCLALSVSLTLCAQQTIESTFGNGVTVVAADESFSMKFNARVQSLFITEVPEMDFSEVETNWLIRRSRLKFSGFAYNPKLQYKIELGLSNRDHGGETPETNNTSNLILDAFIKWKVVDNFEIWVGQTKLPGNRERVISSQKLQFVDRSLVNSRFNIDRDMGIQFRNKHMLGGMVFKEAVAISQGEGRNRTVGNQGGLEYTGRVEFLPMGEFTRKGDYVSSDLEREATPKLAIGLTFDHNANAARERGNLGSYVADTAYNSLQTVLADFMFKYNGWVVAGEYANKKALGERLVAGDEFISNYYTGSGVNVQLGYLFKNNVEPAFRYTEITPESAGLSSDRDLQKMYTFGLSKYVVGHSLKVQTDVSFIDNDAAFSLEQTFDMLFRFQVEMAF